MAQICQPISFLKQLGFDSSFVYISHFFPNHLFVIKFLCTYYSITCHQLRSNSSQLQLPDMFHVLSTSFRRLWSRARRLIHRHPRPKLVIRRLVKLSSKFQLRNKPRTGFKVHQNGHSDPIIRLATFNAAMFSLAPAVPKAPKSVEGIKIDDPLKPGPNDHLKGILKQSPLHSMINNLSENEDIVTKSKMKVSINLPENEISLAQNNNLAPMMRSPICFPVDHWLSNAGLHGNRTVLDVLKEMDADILALQDVKAEEEKDMKPLSDLARALGMSYVFAESWAPEYGNAVLSRWPIKKWKAQKICDDQDFRLLLNVRKNCQVLSRFS